MLKIDQTDFTICMWFCAPNLPVATGWLLSGTVSSAPYVHECFTFLSLIAWSHHENEQKFRLCFGPNPLRASISITATLNFVAPDVPSVVCTGGSLEKGTWHHVAMTWRRADRLLTLFVDAVEAAHAQLPEGVSSLTYEGSLRCNPVISPRARLRPTPSKWQLGRSPTGDWERCHMTDICVLSRAADVDSLRRIAIGNRPCLLARLFAIAPLDCLALDFDALRKVAVRNKGKERLAALHDEGDREADKEHAASLALNGPNADIKIDFVGADLFEKPVSGVLICV